MSRWLFLPQYGDPYSWVGLLWADSAFQLSWAALIRAELDCFLLSVMNGFNSFSDSASHWNNGENG